MVQANLCLEEGRKALDLPESSAHAISRMERPGPGISGALVALSRTLVQEHTVIGDVFKETNAVTGD